MKELLRRLRYLLNRCRADEELADELEFHREMAADQGGLPLGNVLRLREEARDVWGWTWIDRFAQDLRYGCRVLRQSPGFTATAILVLAVGIGVNLAAFSLFNLTVIRFLPVRDPQSIVRLQRRSPDASTNVVPYPSMLFYRNNSKALQTVMGTMGGRILVDDDVQPSSVDFTTENYFKELGEPPSRGRLFDPTRDAAVAASPTVILSYGFWQRRFGADLSIVGKTIRLNKKTATVIGITSFQFTTLGGHRPDLWLPVSQLPYFVEGSHALTDTNGSAAQFEMWGRLSPGITAKMAEEELLLLTNELRRRYPKEIWDKEYVRVDAGGHLQVLQKDMYLVLSLVGVLALLILAVACANLGGLLLARGVSREREISIRVAIGAGSWRIVRQLFTESLLLAFLGSAAGLALGYIVLRIGLIQTRAPAWMSATPDWRVLLFALGMSLITAILFGLTPALQIARNRQGKHTVRQILLTAQVIASCVLLIVSGLLARAAQHALYTYPGFSYERVLSVDPGLSGHGYSPAVAKTFLVEFGNRLRSLPGVTSVALTSMPPLGHERIATITNTIDGHKVPIYPFQVDPAFFETMSIPLLRGRNFLPGEKNAVIVSESLARRQWPGVDAVGKRDASGSSPGDIVIGIAGNARLLALNDGDAVELYHAAQPADMPGMSVIVKTAGLPDRFVPAAKSISQSIDPKLFIYVRLLKGEFRKNLEGATNVALTVSVLGFVAVALAALGLFGLVAYVVSERRKEIAIRIALGAQPGQILSVVLAQFMKPVGCGLLAGVAGAAALSQLLQQGLYGLSHLDPISYVGAVVILIATALCSAFIPARRALTIQCIKALHHQ